MDKVGIRFYMHLFYVNSQRKRPGNTLYSTNNFEDLKFLVRFFKKPLEAAPKLKRLHPIK